MTNISLKTNGDQDGGGTMSANIELYIVMGMVALLSICGILGNSLVIFVFSRQKQKLSSTIFILTLAVTDFITSLITMPYTVVTELLEYEIEYDFLCKLFQFMKTTTIPFSAFVMVAIAMDRYLCIVYPFKHYMTIRRAKVTVVCLSILAFGLGIISALCNGMVETCDTDNVSDPASYSVSYRSNSSMTNFDAIYSMSENRTDSTVVQSSTNRTNCRLVCNISMSILDLEFIYTFLKVYSSLFGICAVCVIGLYAMTYRSVLIQRRKRLHLRNMCCGFLTRSVSENGEHRQDNTEFTVLNNETDSPAMNGNKQIKGAKQKDKSFRERVESNESNGCDNAVNTSPGNDTQIRPSGVSRARLKKLRMANIKTALMLSIVAFIYIVAFTPAWMMALELLKLNLIVYYLYFTYNVANPVIYAFLNHNFRTQLQTIFNCKCGH